MLKTAVHSRQRARSRGRNPHARCWSNSGDRVNTRSGTAHQSGSPTPPGVSGCLADRPSEGPSLWLPRTDAISNNDETVTYRELTASHAPCCGLYGAGCDPQAALGRLGPGGGALCVVMASFSRSLLLLFQNQHLTE